jgi:pimeloyl-ACP methyl ester carboxylesterase
MSDSGQECAFVVDGLTYRGIEWGNPEGPLIIALHGWLDNALSFSVLAPHLAQFRLVALDLSGQGHSDHRSADATYHIWDDVPQLLGIVEQLDEGSVTVMGHSRGAAIAVLLAAALGDRCSHLVLLDGMLPIPAEETAAPQQFVQAQRDREAARTRRRRHFTDVAGFINARVKLGFSESSARLLAPRALRPHDNGFELTHDPRLNQASAVKLTAGMIADFYASLSVKTLVLVAEEGLRVRTGLEASLQAISQLPDCRVHRVPGKHHTHMEEGAKIIATKVGFFLEGASEGATAEETV